MDRSDRLENHHFHERGETRATDPDEDACVVFEGAGGIVRPFAGQSPENATKDGAGTRGNPAAVRVLIYTTNWMNEYLIRSSPPVAVADRRRLRTPEVAMRFCDRSR